MLGLGVGLLFTAAFAAVAIGYLNMISIAFAVLFIGLGLDYSLHLFLRYREFFASGMKHDEALVKAVSQVGQSLWLCAITTCAGFYAFVPTDYKGVAQLGIISGTGMFINFFIQISLLPALVHLFPHQPGSLKPFAPSRMGAWFSRQIQVHSLKIRWASLAIAIFGIWAATQMRFDPNPLSLQDPNTQALKTFERLMGDEGRSPWTAKVVERDRQKAEQMVSKLQTLPEVSQVLWAGGFGAPEEHLPKDLLERFKNSDGDYRIEIFAKENLNDLAAMRKFKDAILPVAPNATDDPVTIPLTADAVVEAFVQAGVLALLLTFLVILWSLANLRDSLLAMTPLVLGGLMTVIVMWLWGEDFNFANIVVLPLLLGIAMDSGIHVIHRFRLSSDENPIAGSTSRAMFFSALVNISSFGTLALAAHRGMSSMGILLSIGLAFMLTCTFVVLPAMLNSSEASPPPSKNTRSTR
jgi:predicted RND superfamily exporter protein